MSNANDSPEALPLQGPVKIGVSVLEIFLEFLLIGATSFGGGVVAYLRSGILAKQRWRNDKEFVELLSISQTLPGLNATNMAILVGGRLRGVAGAMAAICGICLPGGAADVRGCHRLPCPRRPTPGRPLSGSSSLGATEPEVVGARLRYRVPRPYRDRCQPPAPICAAGPRRRRHSCHSLVPDPQPSDGECETMNQPRSFARRHPS